MASYPYNDDYGELSNEIRMVLIGRTGSGKSATGNTILGIKHFKSKFCGNSVTEKCQSGNARRFGKDILLVDTPGLFDTGKTTAEIWKEICKCIGMTTPGPHAILLVVEPRRFTDEEKETVDFFEAVLGDGMFKYLIVVFTKRDEVERQGTTIKEYLEDCPNEVKNILEKCDQQYTAFDNYTEEKGVDDARKLIGMVQEITEKNGGSYYTCEMYQEAEENYRRRVEELIIQKEREKEEEREKIEAEYKKKTDKIFAEMQSRSDELQKQVEEAYKRERELKVQTCKEKEAKRQKIEAERIELQAKIENIEKSQKRERRENMRFMANFCQELTARHENQIKNIRQEIRGEYEEEKGVFENFGLGIDNIGQGVYRFGKKTVDGIASFFSSFAK